MYRKNFPGRKEQRAAAAKERQDAYAKLTTEQKLERLTKMGITSGKQHLRLTLALANKK